MSKKSSFTALTDRLFSNTYQLQRLVILTAVVLVISLVSFGIYYYNDRYAHSQPTVKEMTIAEAEQAVNDDPQNADKRLALAQTYMIYRRFDDAITQALQVKQSYPDNLVADFVLGVAYANNGNPQAAIDPLTKFIDSRKDEDMAALDKQLQSAYYFLGDSYLQLNQPEQAIQPLLTTVNAVRTDADAIYKLGMAYLGTQKYEDAVGAFRRATAFVPDFIEAYQGMAKAYDALNQPSQANYARAMILYSQKDYNNAFTMLTKVAQEQPNFAPAFTGMGLICETQANLKCALDSYQAAAMLDPNDVTASEGVQRVQAAMKK